MNTEFRKNVVEVESYCALLDTQSCRNSLQHFDDFTFPRTESLVLAGVHFRDMRRVLRKALENYSGDPQTPFPNRANSRDKSTVDFPVWDKAIDSQKQKAKKLFL